MHSHKCLKKACRMQLGLFLFFLHSSVEAIFLSLSPSKNINSKKVSYSTRKTLTMNSFCYSPSCQSHKTDWHDTQGLSMAQRSSFDTIVKKKWTRIG
ncbi:hypothetical protein BDF20DRAFT_672846 [Mycotypha africana]|uniref:uncharacterized protein n=1 Tax=Mycotypha africana TaxID=64632 RepID=UPI00230004B2|nr:uncharacterized protein BDF20DRAFT_672846 [Mycotypha africana]KAI8973796.1 hypothetical protein BDF20DRAFT_672846 [Mycotypha africana]